MEEFETETDGPIREVIRRTRELPVAGFTERAILAVRRDVRRRRIIRWASVSAPLAGCAAAFLFLLGAPSAQSPSDRDLLQLVSLHEEVTAAVPRLDDPDALAALVLADS